MFFVSITNGFICIKKRFSFPPSLYVTELNRHGIFVCWLFLTSTTSEVVDLSVFKFRASLHLTNNLFIAQKRTKRRPFLSIVANLSSHDVNIFFRSLKIARRTWLRHVVHAWQYPIFNGNANPTQMQVLLHITLWILYTLRGRNKIQYFALKSNSRVFPYFPSIEKYFKTVVTKRQFSSSSYFVSLKS